MIVLSLASRCILTKCLKFKFLSQFYLPFQQNSKQQNPSQLSRVHAPPKRPPLYFSILGDLSRLYYEKTIDTDFAIYTEDGKKKHEVHRFVLMFRSKYFQSLFRSGLKESVQNEMTIDEVSSDVMETILKYIYLGIFKYDSMDALIDLLIACNYDSLLLL